MSLNEKYMKQFYSSLALILILCGCQRSELDVCLQEHYKGKLVIKGICMNYVIELVEGNLDEDLYVTQWVDEFTGKKYQNVFALGSVCNFPDRIEEGDLFEFVLKNKTENCAVCEAYRPVPNKSLSIHLCD